MAAGPDDNELKGWDEGEEDEVVSDLLPATIEGVARRLRGSQGFVQLVYRESELDALWSLADLAVGKAAEHEPPEEAGPLGVEGAGPEDRRQLRDLIHEAHDLVAASRTNEAAELLTRAASLCSSWSA
ncbi:MAG: hypothetical protein J2O39_03340 [Acidimicrobiales bacterium]|nr:hypothetical protein [Acidimicrobiales bacterium]